MTPTIQQNICNRTSAKRAPTKQYASKTTPTTQQNRRVPKKKIHKENNAYNKTTPFKQNTKQNYNKTSANRTPTNSVPTIQKK